MSLAETRCWEVGGRPLPEGRRGFSEKPVPWERWGIGQGGSRVESPGNGGGAEICDLNSEWRMPRKNPNQ